MKKIISILLLLVLTITALIGCGNKETTAVGTTVPETESETKPGTKPETIPETDPETEPETEPETQPEEETVPENLPTINGPEEVPQSEYSPEEVQSLKDEYTGLIHNMAISSSILEEDIPHLQYFANDAIIRIKYSDNIDMMHEIYDNFINYYNNLVHRFEIKLTYEKKAEIKFKLEEITDAIIRDAKYSDEYKVFVNNRYAEAIDRLNMAKTIDEAENIYNEFEYNSNIDNGRDAIIITIENIGDQIILSANPRIDVRGYVQVAKEHLDIWFWIFSDPEYARELLVYDGVDYYAIYISAVEQVERLKTMADNINRAIGRLPVALKGENISPEILNNIFTQEDGVKLFNLEAAYNQFLIENWQDDSLIVDYYLLEKAIAVWEKIFK